METEPTKVSVKTMKETIRRAGLSTADMLEKRDIEARYKQAQARLEEAERLEREKNQPKKKRRIIEESSDDDDDGGRDSLIPEATGNKKSNVAPFARFKAVYRPAKPPPRTSACRAEVVCRVASSSMLRRARCIARARVRESRRLCDQSRLQVAARQELSCFSVSVYKHTRENC